MCTSADTVLEPDQCVYYNNETYDLSSCDNHQFSYCQVTAEANSSCTITPQKPSVNIALPGEPCVFDLACYESICYKNICLGLPADHNCTQDAQCDVGNFCDGSLCQPQIDIGVTGCSRDFMCANNAGCYLGECVAYFSLTPGTPLSACTNGENYICSSRTCANVNGKSVCTSPVTSTKTLPFACVADNECMTSIDPVLAQAYSTGCTCGYNGFGESYCGLASGDPQSLNLTNWLTRWYNSEAIKMCHTTRRLGDLCMKTFWENDSYVGLQFFLS